MSSVITDELNLAIQQSDNHNVKIYSGNIIYHEVSNRKLTIELAGLDSFIKSGVSEYVAVDILVAERIEKIEKTIAKNIEEIEKYLEWLTNMLKY